MTKKNTTKRALFASVLSLLLCVSMLIGSTFAWFTDNASTGVNTIQSGNLDIVLSYKNATQKTWKEVSETDKLFDDNALWEPGYTEVAYLKIENSGSLALKYQLTVNVLNEVAGTNKDGGTIKLSEVLKYDLIELTSDTTYADRAAALAAVSDAKNLATETVSGTMEAKATAKYFALVVYMPTTTGNDANHKTGTTPPSIQLGVNLLAIQQSSENDSFGNDYDAGVLFDNERRANNDAELAALLAGDLTGVDTIYLGAGEFKAFGFNNIYVTIDVDFVGAVDGTGNPATKIINSESITDIANGKVSGGHWRNYTGTIENIIFEAGDGVANGSNNDYDALYLQDAGGVTFKNCSFVNQGIKFNGDVDFVDCEFDGKNHAEKALNYCVVPNGATSTLTDCVIKNYTNCGINVAESYGSLTIDGCELSNCQATGEYGIHIGQIDNLTIKNCTLNCDVMYYSSLTGNYSASGNTFGEGYSNKAE